MPLIVIDARESGTSTGRYVDKLVENLQKLKPDLDFIILTKPHRLDFMKAIAPDFEVIESNFKEFTFAEQIGLLKQLRVLNADLVHFAHTQQPVLYHGKAVTTIHDLTTARFRNPAKNQLVFGLKQAVYKLVIRIVAHKSIHVITPSKYVKNDVAQYAKIKPSKITVTYEAADKIVDLPIAVTGLTGQKFLLYVGRPQPHKNLQRLVEAYSIARQKHPELRLVLAGKKDVLYERLEAWAEKEHIQGLSLVGFVSDAQLKWLYERCAAYAFPSLSEGFGLPGLEAMVHGAPVLSSNATCLPEIYGDAAHYFKPLDVLDIANKIKGLLENAKLRSELIRASRVQASKYSWQRLAEQTLDVYRKALNT
ncbi:MAG TPA: glycosyltransferase family 1 protein [Candidatus Saccharimonadales bacterium]|nr:glycosyltransferase family 1 protein [Candidatus Saccharimonadales bacterium]